MSTSTRHVLTFAVTLAFVVVALGGAEARPTKAMAKQHPCCIDGKPTDWALYNKGVKWVESLEDAQRLAQDQHRPILYHVLVGDMNKEGT